MTQLTDLYQKGNETMTELTDLYQKLTAAQIAWLTIGPRKHKWGAKRVREKIEEWTGAEVNPAIVAIILERSGLEALEPNEVDGGVLFRQEPSGFSNTTERDIEAALVAQLDSLLGLKLFFDADGRSGKQYRADDFGRIDLIAKDASDNFVVIELKREITTREVIGQLACYKAFVEEKLARPVGRPVAGWILARRSSDPSEDTILEKGAGAAGFTVKWYRLQLAIE